ncbi:MAG: SDR family oxidoreductase [Spirochaetota bacterium]|nr:SDR family oxidoreductase [Spirochaetota bacterium]
MKVALITGGSKGIGREAARLCLKEGMIVYILGRDVEALEETANLLDPEQKVLFSIQADVTDHLACKRSIDEVITRHGRLDLLINNAGMSMRGRVNETTPEVLEAMVHINFLGSAYMTYYALPHITGQKGSIIFTSSLVALHGVPKVAGYAAGKGALTAYTESLRAEVSSKGVHIGIIYVGFTENDPKKVIYSADGSLIPLSKRKNAHTQQDVARYMLKMIKRRKKRMVLTPLGHFSSFLYRFFPNLSDWIIARFNPTNAQYSEAN